MNYSTVTLSSKRQFTIPKAIRQQLGIKPGDRVALTVANGVIVLRPIGSIVRATADSLAKDVGRRR